MSLPAIQALVDSGEDTYLVARSVLQRNLASRIAGLRGIILEQDFDASLLATRDKYFNLRDHPLQLNFWWGSPEFDKLYPGFKINDILKIICTDFDINANFENLQPLPFIAQSEAKDKIVFIPGSDGTYKCWPKQYWLSLASWFNEQGVGVIVIGEPDSSLAVRELLPHLVWFPTPEITHALDIISSAQAVVAVDTGLMHLAVHQGMPTVALYRSHPIYQRPYTNCFPLTARSCDARCVQTALSDTYSSLTNLANFNYQSWYCQADKDQFCMGSIACENVSAIAQAKPELFLGTKNKVLSAGTRS